MLISRILFLSRFYFPLIFHFFDGSLNSFLITKKLVRAQRAQILIKFKKYGHTSGERNIDDVLVRDACQRGKKTVTASEQLPNCMYSALFLRLTCLKTTKNCFQPPTAPAATEGSIFS